MRRKSSLISMPFVGLNLIDKKGSVKAQSALLNGESGYELRDLRHFD